MESQFNLMYNKLNEFFLNRFKKESSRETLFKLDSTYLSIDPNEFLLNPSNPDMGINQALANERFSEIVNYIPEINSSNEEVYFTETPIDGLYSHIIYDAIPFIPSSFSDNNERQKYFESISKKISESQNRFKKSKQGLMNGLPLDRTPSYPLPQNWLDPKCNSWQLYAQEFTDKSTIQKSSKQEEENMGLWQLAIEPKILENIRKEYNVNLQLNLPKKQYTEVIDQNRSSNSLPWAKKNAPSLMPSLYLKSNQISMNKTFQFKDIIKISAAINKKVVTRKVSTSSFQIKFEYCIIRASRPWLDISFLEFPDWCHRTWKKSGELSVHTIDNMEGKPFPAIPTAFLAVRNLKIAADWSQEDIRIGKDSCAFGPFLIEKFTEDNSEFSFNGIQIMGWFFDLTPLLPPKNYEL